MAVVNGLVGVERESTLTDGVDPDRVPFEAKRTMREYSVGEIIPVARGTELNRGPSEDSESIVLDSLEQGIVLGGVASGAMAISLPFYPDLQPLYFHQPEKKVGLR